MSRLSEIQSKISTLSPEEMTQFTLWFEEFCAGVWDVKFESDVKNGKLDKLADEALRDFKADKCSDL